MRALLSKLVAGSMVAGAALLASACTNNEEVVVNNTTDVDVIDTANITDEAPTMIDSTNTTEAMNDGAMMEETNEAMTETNAM